MLQLLHRSEASGDGSVSSTCSACVFMKRGVSQSLAAHAPATMDASGGTVERRMGGAPGTAERLQWTAGPATSCVGTMQLQC